jgi:hypothetical protein
MDKGKKLIGTTYLTPQTTCRINRRRYNRIQLYSSVVLC